MCLFSVIITDVYDDGGDSMRCKEKLNQKGFTLIEMVMVLFIISVLMLLIVPNVVKQKNQIDTQFSTDVKVLYNKAKNCKSDYAQKVLTQLQPLVDGN